MAIEKELLDRLRADYNYKKPEELIRASVENIQDCRYWDIPPDLRPN